MILSALVVDSVGEEELFSTHNWLFSKANDVGLRLHCRLVKRSYMLLNSTQVEFPIIGLRR